MERRGEQDRGGTAHQAKPACQATGPALISKQEPSDDHTIER
jgi:hypothetical protein